MGNFYCIEESCARVVYREYLPPVVRWQYPGEAENEIEGDDYQVDQAIGQCSTPYRVFGTYENKNIKYGNDREIKYWKTEIEGAVIGVVYQGLFRVKNDKDQTQFINDISNNGNVYIDHRDYGFNTVGANIAYDDSVVITNVERIDNQLDNCGECQFTVTKNGEIVHEEVRADCPKVKLLDCQISNKQQIKIEKTPFVSGIEVLAYARDAQKIPGVPFPLPTIRPIPNECLNIYLAELFDFLPDNLERNSDDPVFGDFIAQICSAPGCPPPEYEVICNCNDLSCPSGSCAVQCGGIICCYDDTGSIVKIINYGDYLDQFFPTNRRGAG